MKVSLDVIRHVQTHCLAMSAPVAWVINWPVIDMDVMVSSVLAVIKCEN